MKVKSFRFDRAVKLSPWSEPIGSLTVDESPGYFPYWNRVTSIDVTADGVLIDVQTVSIGVDNTEPARSHITERTTLLVTGIGVAIVSAEQRWGEPEAWDTSETVA